MLTEALNSCSSAESMAKDVVYNIIETHCYMCILYKFSQLIIA